MQILADANNSQDRNTLRNWMYSKPSTLKCVWRPRLISPPFRIKRREREMDFRFSRAHLFFIHSRERVDFRARDSSSLRSRAIRASSREQGRESRRECSFINKEQRGERKRAQGNRRRRCSRESAPLCSMANPSGMRAARILPSISRVSQHRSQLFH